MLEGKEVHFGGRIFLDSMFNTEVSLAVCQAKEILLDFGMIFSMVLSTLKGTLCYLNLQRIQGSPFSKSERQIHFSAALEFLCLDRPIMNSWIWIQSSSKCLQTAMRRMTVGFLSGETSIILQASTIDISSPLCIHLKPLFGSGRENVSQRLNSFFAWLLLNDRLNTRNLLSRRKKFLEEGYCCVLCQNDLEETSEHLFFF